MGFAIVTQFPRGCVDDDTESSTLFFLQYAVTTLYLVKRSNLLSRMWICRHHIFRGTHFALAIDARRASSCATPPYGQAGMSFYCSFLP